MADGPKNNKKIYGKAKMKTRFQWVTQDSRKSRFPKNTIRLGVNMCSQNVKIAHENQIPKRQSGFAKIRIRRKYN